jgi:hypothetical protein
LTATSRRREGVGVRTSLGLALAGIGAATGYFVGRLLAAPDLEGEEEYRSHRPVRLRLDVGDGGGFDLWTETDDLVTSEPAERVFELDPRSGELRFGDGARGAAPPAGADVRVAYRSGGGESGNL